MKDAELSSAGRPFLVKFLNNRSKNYYKQIVTLNLFQGLTTI
ncbi:hypothetical protein EV200_106155 [Pedobacter psychrotolerans]|uniref:Uncharacterized protein n=1 Tax=Pedobacter psychrotolerans TaxID=1843235 RepID=A0A4R2H7Y2_9SPHI|nr:hypothetical protein EV200_106155 [Pedobacter psychrotolerans]